MAAADVEVLNDAHVTKKAKKSKKRMRESEGDAATGVKPTRVMETAQAESVGMEVSMKKKGNIEKRKRKVKNFEEAADDGIQVGNTGPKAASSEVVRPSTEKRSKKEKPPKKRRKDENEMMESHSEAGIAAAGPTSAADKSGLEMDRANGNGRVSETNGIDGSRNTKGDKALPQVTAIPTTWEQVGLPEPVQPAKKRKHGEVSGTSAKPKKQKKSDRKKQKLVEPDEEHEDLPRREGRLGSISIPERDDVIETEDARRKAQSNGEAKLDGAEKTLSSRKDPAVAAAADSRGPPDPPAAKKLKPKKSRTKTKPEPATNADTSDDHINHTDQAPSTTSNHQRFIVFVGNLPFSATTEQIKAHFSSVNPTSIRHLTVKDDPSKSKGFAFLEFDNYDRMKTCLKLYHHSGFPVVGGKGGKKVEAGTEGNEGNVRRINVELTVGGGGSKSVQRKEKLQAKNERLSEQRKRRAEAEEEQGKRKARKDKGGQNAGPAESGTAEVGLNGADETTKGAVEGEKGAKIDRGGGEMGDMHPSRRARMG